MNWLIALFFPLSAMLSPTAFGDELRHPSFGSALVGTWAETAEKCKANDESNVVIEPVKYGDAMGVCEVRWIVITAGAGGTTNYAAHSLCTNAKDATKTETVNIIARPLGPDRALMGRSFNDLKNYQRCSAE